MLSFRTPWLLVTLVSVPLIWWIARTAPAPVPSIVTAMRLLVATCLALAAAGLEVSIGRVAETVVLVMDRSRSMEDDLATALAHLTRVATAGREGVALGVVFFGGEVAIGHRPSLRPPKTDPPADVDGESTDIEAALAVAQRLVPDGAAGRLVLWSDGHETKGRAIRAAARAAAAGIRIDVFPPSQSPADARLRPPRVSDVSAPPVAAAGEPFGVGISVEGAAAGRGVVALRRGDTEVRQGFALDGSGRAHVSFTERADVPGPVVYTASVVAAIDEVPDIGPEEAAGAVVVVAGPPSVLYVSPAQPSIDRALHEARLDLRRIHPDDLPPSPFALARHACVVLDDVDVARLTVQQREALRSFVEDGGGGLLVVGTEATLGAAGYPQTVLDRLLPVDFRPRRGRRGPGLALVVLVDKSGSMADATGGIRHIELARQAVRNVLDVLPPSDMAGVIAFEAGPPTTVLPLQSVEAGRRQVRLDELDAGGSTTIAPALELGLRWLRAASVAEWRRQILIVSDGRTADSDRQRVLAALKMADVTVSVVAVGGHHDREFLETLARTTGGRAYHPADVRELPLAVAREAVAATGGGTVRESFLARAAAHPILSGLDALPPPALSGYVVGVTRPGATAVLRSHLDDPVLAVWQAGLGRVGVLTAPAAGAGGLAPWEGAAQLHAQTVRWLGQPPAAGAVDVRMADEPDGLSITVDVHEPTDLAVVAEQATALVREPDGRVATVPLRQVAPGRFHGRSGTTQPGPYVVTATVGSGAADTRVLRGHYRRRLERPVTMPNLAVLQEVARKTGGKVLGPGEPLPALPGRPETRDAGSWLVGTAIAAFMASVLSDRFRGGLGSPRRGRAGGAVAGGRR